MKAAPQTSKTPTQSPSAFLARPAYLLRRKCTCGVSTGIAGECDSCRQEKLLPSRTTGSTPMQVAHAVLRSSGQPLDPTTRAFMEPRFGHDFAKVRVHAGNEAAAAAERVHALAYTIGGHIVFGAGQYHPGTTEGHRLIAHELAHVVQQTDGTPKRLQRQADEKDQRTTTDMAEGTVAEEDGSGVETEESSTESDDLGVVGEEEDTQAQLKAAGEGAAPELPNLEQEADRAADDALSNRPVRVSVGAASITPQRAPKEPAVPTRCGRPDTRVSDFPNTFIQNVSVDLTSPAQSVTLTWAGPSAGAQPTGPFHSSPGAGCCGKNCDDEATSKIDGSHCTPKGSWNVNGHSCKMDSFPEARNVTWFARNGIALHFYPSVPNWPASHGCVRIGQDASRIIHDNSVRDTTVKVTGTWTRHDAVCWSCGKKKKGAKK